MIGAAIAWLGGGGARRFESGIPRRSSDALGYLQIIAVCRIWGALTT